MNEQSSTAGSRSVLPFEPAVLETYLAGRLAVAGPMTLQPIVGGQSNPTYFVNFGLKRYVLRKKPPGVLLPSAHAVDREYRVQEAIAGSGVPVAPMVLFCEDPGIVGTPFYLMERVEGRIFADSALAAAPPAERGAMYRSAARALASIHAVDIDKAGLRDFGWTGGYIARQIERWSKQWKLSAIDGIPEIDPLENWLRANMPDGADETALVHGDFRIGNLIFHSSEPRVVAVLDWELSTLGDPMSDLAHSLVYAWHLKPTEYGGVLGLDLHREGLPSSDDFVADYMAASAAPRQLTRYHLAFALYRNAVIFAGIAARARDGNAAADNAAETGALAPVFARRGLAIAQE